MWLWYLFLSVLLSPEWQPQAQPAWLWLIYVPALLAGLEGSHPLLTELFFSATNKAPSALPLSPSDLGAHSSQVLVMFLPVCHI